MRIVHTSDWHAGRVWKGVDRLLELQAALSGLVDYVLRERVDLVVVTGDVFDTGAPPARAERVVFEALKRLGCGGVSVVVIAGNHDSPARLQAWGTLAELVSVRVVAYPCRAEHGGVLEVEGRAPGERAVVAAVPFAPVRSLVSALERTDDEAGARRRYAEGFAELVAHLAGRFRPDAVNLLLAHTHLEGALLSGSERTLHLGDAWAAAPRALPAAAHYVALGHVHRPQRLVEAPVPTLYAGSPLQLDFGEAGEAKSFVVVEARPGAPARIERVPYEGTRPLRRVRGTLDELAALAPDLEREGAWLRVTVRAERPDPDVNGKVRRLLPAALAVDVELPARPEQAARDGPAPGAPPRALFASYHRRVHGAEAPGELLAAFDELHAAAREEESR